MQGWLLGWLGGIACGPFVGLLVAGIVFCVGAVTGRFKWKGIQAAGSIVLLALLVAYVIHGALLVPLMMIGAWCIGVHVGRSFNGWSDGLSVMSLLLLSCSGALAQTTTGTTSSTDPTTMATTAIAGWQASVMSIGQAAIPVVLAVAGIMVVLGIILRVGDKV